MPVQRFLGAAWAAVHGPSDPTLLLRWICEARFSGIVPAPAPRSVDWGVVGRLARDFPVGFPAVRATSVLTDRPATGALSASRESERLPARQCIEQAIGTAAKVGCRNVIVEPGLVSLIGEVGPEDLGDPQIAWTQDRAQALVARRKAGLWAALDIVCRELYSICKAHPEVTLCLTPGRSLRAVAGREALAAIFEDLGNCRLAYWHDTAVVARREQVLGEPQGSWLEDLSNRCVGCTLGDSCEDGMYRPPGSGGVDYPLLTSYLRRGTKALPACLELDPAVAAAELPGMRAYLEKFGL